MTSQHPGLSRCHDTISRCASAHVRRAAQRQSQRYARLTQAPDERPTRHQTVHSHRHPRHARRVFQAHPDPIPTLTHPLPAPQTRTRDSRDRRGRCDGGTCRCRAGCSPRAATGDSRRAGGESSAVEPGSDGMVASTLSQRPWRSLTPLRVVVLVGALPASTSCMHSKPLV